MSNVFISWFKSHTDKYFSVFNTLNFGDVYTLRWIGSSLYFSEWLGVLTPGHSLKHQHATEDICQLNQSTIFISFKIHCIKDAWKYMENLLCIFVLFFCKYYAFDSSSIWQNGGNFAHVKSCTISSIWYNCRNFDIFCHLILIPKECLMSDHPWSVVALQRIGDKPLSYPVMTQLGDVNVPF